jgi:hypothetical protein
MLGLTGVTMSQAAVEYPFSIDGTVPDVLDPEPDDYQVTDPSGNTQELGPLNSNATKVGVIHSAVPPMLGYTNPNGQTDLRNVWVTSKTVDGDVWLYFAWERDANRGSGFIMYEFQQNALSATCDYETPVDEAALISGCNPWENRQPGDFIVVWDQSGNALDIKIRTFEDPDGGTFDLGDPLVLGIPEDLSPDNYKAAISGDKFRGEATINLSEEVFPAEPTSCQTLANIIPGTVTGNSDTADYKDTVLGDFVDISNCGKVEIVKDTDDDGTDGFGYTLERSSGAAIRYGTTPPTQATGTVSEGSPVTEINLRAGTDYTLSEQIGSLPYDLASITCVLGTDTWDVFDGEEDFTVVAGQTTVCTMVNNLQDGTLIVDKVVVNDNGGTAGAEDFTFSVDGAASVPFEADASNEFTVDAGTHDVVEDAATGYTTTYDNCSDVVVPAGGTATCTITNDDQPGTLIVNKVVVNDNGGTADAEDFTFSVDGAASVPFEADASNEFSVDAGTHDVVEDAATGYTTTYDNCADVVITNGGTATCTITNDDQPGTLIVTKVLTQDNGRTETVEDFSYTIDGGSSVAFEPDGSNSHTVDAGTYDVVEDDAAGYATTYSDSTGGECLDIVVPNGGTATCTITNDDEKASPTGTTVQSWVLHDDLTIAGLRDGATDAEDATATFRLYADASCATQVGDDEVVDLTGTTAGTSVGVTVTESGDYFWRVSYSGDQFNDSFTTGCGDEITDIRALDAYEEGRNDFE